VKLREIAIKKGLKLNEYGLFKGKKSVAGKTEEEVYKALGLHYIEPEIREDNGEIELALRQAQGKPGGLPKLIGYDDLMGNMQTHTDWSDGEATLEETAKAAIEVGLQYILITDHTRGLAMTGGADEKKMLKQMEEIDKLNSKFKSQKSKFRILKGAEVNIGKNGELDLDEKVLEKMDVVGAAVHSYFNLSRAEQTKRIITAMENPHIDIIFHLTGRLINKREAITIDFDEILKVAKKTGTILEIDAYPDRLDIKDDFIKKCVEAGVKMSIGADAHSPEHYKYLEIGIAQARRGWTKKSDIINAWSLDKMLKFLK
ncbi:MAG: PHP domain-containing protein, partial [Patescibacteria group bacterium]